MERARVGGSATKVGGVGFEKYRKSAVKSSFKFYIMGGVIAAAAFFIVFFAMQGATVYYLEVHQVLAKSAAGTLGADPVRLNGQVLPGTIVKDPANNSVTFKTIDMTQKDQFIMARYSGLLPDTFKDEAQVVLTGKIDPVTGTFVATEMLAKCPSKYSTTAS